MNLAALLEALEADAELVMALLSIAASASVPAFWG